MEMLPAGLLLTGHSERGSGLAHAVLLVPGPAASGLVFQVSRAMESI